MHRDPALSTRGDCQTADFTRNPQIKDNLISTSVPSYGVEESVKVNLIFLSALPVPQ